MDCTHPRIVRDTSRFDILSDVRKRVHLSADEFIEISRGGGITVRCGKCFNCRRFKSREWTNRLILENECHDMSLFLTLTYDDEHLTYTDKGYMTLVVSDLQNFFKRLRNNLLGLFPIRYFACGEYGDLRGRPHYHALIFGIDRDFLPLIEKSWTLGRVNVGTVTSASVAYVAGYIQKKLYGKALDESKYDYLQPFSLKSLKPAIGRTWLDEHYREVFDKGYIQFPGYTIGIPRYFRDVLRDVYGLEFDSSIYKMYQEEADEKEKEYWSKRISPGSIIECEDGSVVFNSIDVELPHLKQLRNEIKERNRIAKSKLFNKGVL